jgi:hypothetical protein
MSDTQTFIDLLREEVATIQARHPQKADEYSRAHALIVDGWVLDNHDGTGQVLASDMSRYYTVNGACECTGATYGKACKHLRAWQLYTHVAKRQAALQPPEAPAPTVPQPVGIAPRHIVQIQGKPYVKFAGLLELAHTRGLQSLTVNWTYNDAELSLAHAEAVFPFGTFAESGDSTPQNVGTKVALHWRRLALTRAKARTLRDALGVDAVAVEELADE